VNVRLDDSVACAAAAVACRNADGEVAGCIARLKRPSGGGRRVVKRDLKRREAGKIERMCVC
jgi:hypothetical protein